MVFTAMLSFSVRNMKSVSGLIRVLDCWIRILDCSNALLTKLLVRQRDVHTRSDNEAHKLVYGC